MLNDTSNVITELAPKRHRFVEIIEIMDRPDIPFYMGNREENISSILKTSLTDRNDKSKTKLISISFYFLRKQCIGLIMIFSC